MPIKQLIARIRQSPIQKSFFHFTDASNIVSIKSNGLLSRRTLVERGLSHITGGNQLSRDLDDHHGLDAYVHLCFRRQHGMAHVAEQEKRIEKCYWLAIDPDILMLPGVLIAPDNSVKAGVTALPAAEALETLDLDVLYTRTDWNDPQIQARLRAAERYEILVPDAVAPFYITF